MLHSVAVPSVERFITACCMWMMYRSKRKRCDIINGHYIESLDIGDLHFNVVGESCVALLL